MLCEGKDPASFTYDEMGFQSHYLKCIKQLKIESFMCKKALYQPQQPKRSKFKIYCVCCLPDTGDEMIYCTACKEWFHYICVELEPGIKVKGKWLCSRCTLINTALI